MTDDDRGAAGHHSSTDFGGEVHDEVTTSKVPLEAEHEVDLHAAAADVEAAEALLDSEAGEAARLISDAVNGCLPAVAEQLDDQGELAWLLKEYARRGGLVLGSEQDGEDLASETAARVEASWDPAKGTRRSWFRFVYRGKLIEVFRSRGRNPPPMPVDWASVPDEDSPPSIPEPVSTAMGPEEVALAEALGRQLKEVMTAWSELAKLSEQERRAFQSVAQWGERDGRRWGEEESARDGVPGEQRPKPTPLNQVLKSAARKLHETFRTLLQTRPEAEHVLPEWLRKQMPPEEENT